MQFPAGNGLPLTRTTMDLRRHLDALAGAGVPPTRDVIEADLDRGRRALRRHRAHQKVAGGAVFLVALAARTLVRDVDR